MEPPHHTRKEFVLIIDCQEHNNDNHAYVRRVKDFFQQQGSSILVESAGGRLPDADYHAGVRTVDLRSGGIIATKVLASTERKTPTDLFRCITELSRRHLGLSTIEVQVRKICYNGVNDKVFLLEGNEDQLQQFRHRDLGPVTQCKAIKTFRMSLSCDGYYFNKTGYNDLTVVQTQDEGNTMKFLFDLVQKFKNLPQNELSELLQRAPTSDQVRANVNNAMTSVAFTRYKGLLAMPGIGPIKAMTRTMELEHPNFICPNLKDYWQRKINKDRTDLQCTDINDPRHQPTLYSGQPEDFPRVLRNSGIGSAPARSPATALTDYHQREPAARSSSTAVSVSHQQRKPPADTATLREHRLRFFSSQQQQPVRVLPQASRSVAASATSHRRKKQRKTPPCVIDVIDLT